MRKVLFKKWNTGFNSVENGMTVMKPGFWDAEFIHEGLFHQWGVAYEEFDTGAGNYSIAIIELSNGSIVEALPSNVKFINQ